jgi:hypothetical protein
LKILTWVGMLVLINSMISYSVTQSVVPID